MDGQSSISQPARYPGRAWLWLSMLAAILAIAGSVISLMNSQIYARLTPAFLPQAIAQDITNLAIASPSLLILGSLALRRSLRAFLLWLGVVVFTVYNYVIYTFSVPFGSLFALWVAVFGMCLYALLGGIASADHRAVQAAYQSGRAVKVIAWALIVAAILFGMLWLSEDIPALLSGMTPQSVTDMAVPTNPVHILDLAFFLPAAILTGIWMLKRIPLAFTLAPALIVFLMLTGIPILLTPFVQTMIGQTAVWSVMAPIGILTLLFFGLLVWLISTIKPGRQGQSH